MDRTESRIQGARDALAAYRQWEADDTLSPDLPTTEIMGGLAAALELLLEVAS